jgi:GNAT superfamily N-acetyltransferase
MPKGTSDLVVVPVIAQRAHEFANTFVNEWVSVHVMKSLVDDNWDYGMFTWDLILRSPRYVSFAAVDAAGRLEGLLALGRSPEGGFLKVEFLATAPWNYGSARERNGVGTGLLSHAIDQSKAAGCGGAVTLSSTARSESFYEGRGFVRTGARCTQNLAIFNLPADRAGGFQSKYPALAAATAPSPEPRRSG